ncbi:MAG TPA: hypothetical protein VFU40_08420 [Gemmatimonadales bacterium]|nr:hypothetical protein [Gemmatimonadales bacterium]
MTKLLTPLGMKPAGFLLLFIPLVHLSAQDQLAPVPVMAARLASIPAVTGYEQALVDTLLRLLPPARRDRAGNVVLMLGRGKPRRLVACPLDEPGYVVGNVREDGYLTLRRVSGRVPPLFDQQLEGNRVTIHGRLGPVPGVVAVRSVHLMRGREERSDDPFSVDDAYVDVGAETRAEVARLGVALLAPVTLAKRPHAYGDSLLAAPVAGRRAACAALLTAARDWLRSGTGAEPAVVAFVVGQEVGQRGIATVANTLGPFEETVILDGEPGPLKLNDPVLDPESSARWPKLGRVTRQSLATRYPETAVETVSLAAAQALARALAPFFGSAP